MKIVAERGTKQSDILGGPAEGSRAEAEGGRESAPNLVRTHENLEHTQHSTTHSTTHKTGLV